MAQATCVDAVRGLGDRQVERTGARNGSFESYMRRVFVVLNSVLLILVAGAFLGLALVIPFAFVLSTMALMVLLVFFLAGIRLPAPNWVLGVTAAILLAGTAAGFVVSVFLGQ